MKRGDIVLITILVTVIALFIIPTWLGVDEDYDGKKYAIITVDREHYQTVELTEDTQELEVISAIGYNRLLIYNQGIQMIESSCPDQLCIAMGFVDRVGQTIVSLPNRVIVEVIGDEQEGDDVDAVVS